MRSYFSTAFTADDHSNFPEYDNIVYLKLSHIYCNIDQVYRVLRNSNPNKSHGPDTLWLHDTKECAAEIADSQCSPLNRLFTSGQVPLAWKIANIFPIHTKGEKSCIENYRFVSLTSMACKVREKLLISGNPMIYLTQSNICSSKVDQPYLTFQRLDGIQKQIKIHWCNVPELFPSIWFRSAWQVASTISVMESTVPYEAS